MGYWKLPRGGGARWATNAQSAPGAERQEVLRGARWATEHEAGMGYVGLEIQMATYLVPVATNAHQRGDRGLQIRHQTGAVRSVPVRDCSNGSWTEAVVLLGPRNDVVSCPAPGG
jgi:hypothetical protein